MSTPNPTSIQIFRAGSQTAMSGEEMSFSEADLAASCAAYDPAMHEAPLVIGHPRHNSPAWGWVQSMAVAGQHLEATPHQLDPEFAELVRAGRFKKISASFYRPDSPNNPVPGVWYLRHVGFLGAQPPAVKGLRQVEFGESGEQGVVEFADWGMEANASLWRRLRDWLLAKHGQETADQVVPDWQIESIREAARQDDDDPRPAFSETNTPQEPHVTPEQAAAIEAENAKLKKQLADALAEKQSAARAAAHASNVSFAEQLIAAGKLLPKHQAVVIAALDVASPPDAPLEFSEGEGVKRPLADGLRELFQQLPPVVEFGELATTARAGSAPATADVAEFAEADADRLTLHGRALRLAQDKNIPYEQAARQLAGR